MSAIEWCDVTWNPVVGCTRVSAGCDNCYAIGVAARNLCSQHRGLTKIRPPGSSRPGADWTGEVRTVPERLGEPFKWRKPRRVFVNSMSDLFHASVPMSFRARVYAVMAECPQHTFIVVTKRPDAAAVPWQHQVSAATMSLEYLTDHVPDWDRAPTWPLPNVHVLASTEDQATWTRRVPKLLEMPAAVRGVSAEPLIGPVEHPVGIGDLDWVVIGGESGRGARVCDVRWIDRLARKAKRDGAAVFVKQLGSASQGAGQQRGKGNDPSTWPAELRIREFPTTREATGGIS